MLRVPDLRVRVGEKGASRSSRGTWMQSWKEMGRQSVGMSRVLRVLEMSDAPLKPDELERCLIPAWSDREDVTWRYRDSKKRGLEGIRPLKNLHPDRDPRHLPSYLSNQSAPFRYILGIPRRRTNPEFQPSAISISLNLLPASALCPKYHSLHSSTITCHPQEQQERNDPLAGVTHLIRTACSLRKIYLVLLPPVLITTASAQLCGGLCIICFFPCFFYRGVAYLFCRPSLHAYRR